MQNRVNFSAKKKFSFLPLGSFSELTLSVQLPVTDLSKLFFDLPTLPSGWDNFEALGTGSIRTTNLSGQPISGLSDEILAIEGELPPLDDKDPDARPAQLHVRIISAFFRTIRLGENEYQWKSDGTAPADRCGRTLSIKSLLENTELALRELRFGLIRYRRLNFGPIPNPFPVRTGELRIRWRASQLELFARFLGSADAAPLQKIASRLSELKITNELLDHLNKSY